MRELTAKRLIGTSFGEREQPLAEQDCAFEAG